MNGSRLAILSAAVITALYGSKAALAADLELDADPNTAGIQDGSANWDLATNDWQNSTNTNVLWDNATPGSAILGAGLGAATFNAANVNIVTINDAIRVSNITFNLANNGGFYQVADNFGSGSLTLLGNVTKAAGQGSSRFDLGNSLTLGAGQHVFAVADSPGDSAPELVIAGGQNGGGVPSITGAGGITIDNGTFQQYGTTAILGASNYSGGTNVLKGRLVVQSNGGLGSGSIVVGQTAQGGGALYFGGGGITQANAINLTNALTITRDTYANPTGLSDAFSNYTDAVVSANTGGGKTLTLNNVTIDSVDGRIAAQTSTVNLPNTVLAGSTVGANSVLTLDGDFAGTINLGGDNSVAGSVGAVRVIGGVEVNFTNLNNLGGASKPLQLQGGTLHLPSNFTALSQLNVASTNFGGGFDVDAGNSFTIDQALTGTSTGKRGTGTLNINATLNLPTGNTFFDGGSINFNSSGTFGAVSLRSPTVTIPAGVTVTTLAGNTSWGDSSTGTNNGPDKAIVNLAGTYTQVQNNDFYLGNQANTTATLNISNTGVFNGGGLIFVGRGGTGTVNLNGGAINLTRNDNFAFVLSDGRDGRQGTGFFNMSGGTFTSAGEVYAGEGGGGKGSWIQTGGTANVNNWFVVGREGSVGTFDISGGTFNHNGGNMSLGDSGPATAGAIDIINIHGNAVVNDIAGEFWVGNGGATALLTQSDTSSVTVNNWLAIGRANAANSVGTYNLTGGTLTKTVGSNGFLAVGSNGRGWLNQTGGTMNIDATRLGEATDGTMTLTGGTANFTGAFSLAFDGSGTLNVGGTANVTLPAVVVGADGGARNGYLNLNGGTVTATSITAGTSTGAKIITFNGGTLMPSAGTTNFVGTLMTSVVSTGGAKLNLNGQTITYNSALTHDATISGADGGLSVSGSGALTLTGAETYTGPTAITGAGTVTLASTASINTTTLNSTSQITNNGTVTTSGGGSIDSIVGTGSLNLTGGTLALANPTLGTLNTQSNVAFSGGKLDIQKNQIQVAGNQYASLASAYTGGNLISSSITAANNTSRVVGIAYNSTNNNTTARYTTYGDVNLDGRFNGTDVTAINAANVFGGAAGSATYAQGDANYDGRFNGTDVRLINGANSFGTGFITNIVGPSAVTADSLVTSSAIAANNGDNTKLNLQYDPSTGDLRVIENGNAYGTITLTATSSVFKDNVSGTSPEFYSDDNGDGTSLFFGVLAGQQTADVLLPGVLDPNQSLATLLNAISVSIVTNGPAASNITFSTTGAVPEPATLGALAMAGGMLLRRRRSA